MYRFIFFLSTFFPICLNAQSVKEKLSAAINKLETDSQFNHSIVSMYVVETNTGKVVYDKNSQAGLAPASCQKVITSAAAFELLGNAFRYNTEVKISSDNPMQLFIEGSGDPTLGSWRWKSTSMDSIYKNIATALKAIKTVKFLSGIQINQDKYTYQPVPDGWVWEDIGNYYGAGAWAFNWHENQYSVFLSSGYNENDATELIGFDPPTAKINFNNLIVTGKKGSGDNAYIYSAPYDNNAFATGTIPPSQKKFTISGSMPMPSAVFMKGLKQYLDSNGIDIKDQDEFSKEIILKNSSSLKTITTISSPTLDSMNYWFMKKSINLYAEAFVKSISYEKAHTGSTDTGVAVIRDFWSKKGIDKNALNILDGSGLSPANRVTTNALVSVMQYARSKNWFPSFRNALPEMNGIKMKDGYIGGVRAYTGYIKSKNGNDYTFSFIVNNFTGNPTTAKEKMWSILDILK